MNILLMRSFFRSNIVRHENLPRELDDKESLSDNSCSSPSYHTLASDFWSTITHSRTHPLRLHRKSMGLWMRGSLVCNESDSMNSEFTASATPIIGRHGVHFALVMAPQEPAHEHGTPQSGKQLRAVTIADCANQAFNCVFGNISRRALQMRKKLVYGRIFRG